MPVVPPPSDLALNNFAANMDSLITATPTAYGLVAADATAFHALAADYATRLATATTPETRTKGTVAAKNTSKAALVAKARQLIKIITAYPPLTAQQRADLGLNPRDAAKTPVPPPATRPLLAVDPDGALRVVDETMPDRRSKPLGVSGAVVFTKVGAATDVPPVTPDDAKFAILATRGRVALPIPANSNGKTLWVLAQWYNERGELGPVSPVVSTTIAA
jgi:hypothetical protein